MILYPQKENQEKENWEREEEARGHCDQSLIEHVDIDNPVIIMSVSLFYIDLIIYKVG